jgi:hypothetical protein
VLEQPGGSALIGLFDPTGALAGRARVRISLAPAAEAAAALASPFAAPA